MTLNTFHDLLCSQVGPIELSPEFAASLCVNVLRYWTVFCSFIYLPVELGRPSPNNKPLLRTSPNLFSKCPLKHLITSILRLSPIDYENILSSPLVPRHSHCFDFHTGPNKSNLPADKHSQQRPNSSQPSTKYTPQASPSEARN